MATDLSVKKIFQKIFLVAAKCVMPTFVLGSEKCLVEWREGISPSRSPRTGRDSLPSSSSYCPALA